MVGQALPPAKAHFLTLSIRAATSVRHHITGLPGATRCGCRPAHDPLSADGEIQQDKELVSEVEISPSLDPRGTSQGKDFLSVFIRVHLWPIITFSIGRDHIYSSRLTLS